MTLGQLNTGDTTILLIQGNRHTCTFSHIIGQFVVLFTASGDMLLRSKSTQIEKDEHD